MIIAPFAALALAIAPTPVQPDLTKYLPGDCLIVIEAPKVSELLEGGLKQPWIQRVRAIPAVKQALGQAPMQPEAALALGSFFLGKPVLPALQELCEGGLVLGLCLEENQAIPYLVIESKNQRTLRSLLQLLSRKIESSQDMPVGSLWSSSKKVHDANLWDLEDFAIAQRGKHLFFSKSMQHVEQMLALDAQNEALSDRANWQGYQKHANQAAKARLWIDTQEIERVAPSSKLGEFRAIANNPAVHFLLGSQFAESGKAAANWIELAGNDDQLQLHLVALAPEARTKNALYAETAPVLGLPKAADTELFRGQLYRNLDALFDQRFDLFPIDIQPKFVEVAANLSLFMGGEDPEEFLFPHLDPWFGVIAREVTLDPKPDLPLPALCVLLHMHDSESLAPQLTAGFQTAIGLINVDAAQEREPSLLLRLENHKGIPITYAHYLQPTSADTQTGPGAMEMADGEADHTGGIDARYNLVPACAIVEDTFILGTHVALVREVAQQVRNGQLDSSRSTSDSLTIQGPTLHRTLAANSDAWILNAMLSEGKTAQQARKELDGMLTVAGQIKSIGTTLSTPSATLTKLSFQLDMLPWRE